MSAAKHTPWQFERKTGEHFLPIDADLSWKVYRTAAGDYALTRHSDADGHGGEVRFFDTLRQAKLEAEHAIAKAIGGDHE